MVSAKSKIKCAAGTLRAYLRRRTDDAKASFVSSRSLSVRGSWGTAPSVFWYGVPGGTQGPLGKGGAAERWRVAYPIGIATRHGAKPATTHTSKRNASAASGAHHAFAKDSATPIGEMKLGIVCSVNPSVSLAADSLSLRLGHGAALICHRHIIHYRAATSLPLTQGRLWVGAPLTLCIREPMRTRQTVQISHRKGPFVSPKISL